MSKIIDWYKNFNEKHTKFCEFARFVIVGGITTLIDMLVMGVILYLFEPSLYPKFYNVWIGKVGDPKTIAAVIGSMSKPTSDSAILRSWRKKQASSPNDK